MKKAAPVGGFFVAGISVKLADTPDFVRLVAQA
jgi:hypothetical protein